MTDQEPEPLSVAELLTMTQAAQAVSRAFADAAPTLDAMRSRFASANDIRREIDRHVENQGGERVALRRIREASDNLRAHDRSRASYTGAFREATGEHTFVTLTNPFLVCAVCATLVPRWHNPETCPCELTDDWWNEPCGHAGMLTSYCPSWSWYRKCRCEDLGWRSTPHLPRQLTERDREDAHDAARAARAS